MEQTGSILTLSRRVADPLSAEDHVAIQQLYLRYSAAVDFRDVDAWMATWTATPEPSMVSHDGKRFTGRDALRAAAVRQRDHAGDHGYHWTNSPLIEATEYGARGMCFLMYVRAAAGAEMGPYTGLPQGEVRYVLHYDDELVRQDGRWLFRERTANVLEP